MQKVEISHRTIVFTVFFLLFLWFLYQIRQIIVLLFIAFIFMSALNPIVDKLETKRLPRSLAIILIYLLIGGVFGSIIAAITPPLVHQTTFLINQLPRLLQRLPAFKLELNLLNLLNSQLINIPSRIFRFVGLAFSNILTLFVLATLTFYLLLERKKLPRYLVVLFGRGDGRKRVERLISRLERSLGGWVRGQITLMFIVGSLVYLGLTLLGIQAALPLALLAGMLEFITNLGPVIATVPAALIGFASSPLMGAAVIALYWLVQQVENNFLVPKVMEKAVGVPPLVAILTLMIGYQLAGVAGAVLSLPTYLVAKELLSEFVFKN